MFNSRYINELIITQLQNIGTCITLRFYIINICTDEFSGPLGLKWGFLGEQTVEGMVRC